MLLADEPTGNLDESMRDEIMDVLIRMWKELGLTFVMVTHDSTLAKQAPRVATIRKGRVTVEENVGACVPAAGRVPVRKDSEAVSGAGGVAGRAGLLPAPRTAP
ncbi:putative ABC transporter ATP-binding protein [Streptomyces sp. AVP053U2]|nr:putative ABC transporter ATP-binding protein [Streptomyces sp. AVP053U2]